MEGATISKKLQEKQERRKAEELRRNAQRAAHRRSNFITVGIALLVLALVVGGIWSQRKSDDVEISSAGADEAGCTEVEEHEDEGNEHIEVGADHPPYQTSPPTSGNHWPPDQIADAAFYTAPVENERLVHNMEHGQVVIWYRPDLESDQLDQLEAIQNQEPVATITVPFAEIEDPYNVVLSAWTVTQSCEEISQEVIDDFREEFQGRGPEQVGIPIYEP